MKKDVNISVNISVNRALVRLLRACENGTVSTNNFKNSFFGKNVDQTSKYTALSFDCSIQMIDPGNVKSFSAPDPFYCSKADF